MEKSTRFLYFGAALTALLAVIAASAVIVHLRQEAVGRHVDITRNLVRSVGQTVEGMVESIDYALQVSADEIAHQIAGGRPDAAAITRFMTRQQERFAHIDLLRATNAQGEAIYGQGVDPAQRASLAQRDYYRKLRDDPRAGLVISEPIIGKISQRWIWLMARRIDNPDGSFAGLIYGSLFIDDLVKQFEELRLAPGSAISLRDEAMRVVARTTFDQRPPLPIGDTRLSEGLIEARKSDPRSGTYESGPSVADGVNRLYSYWRSDRYGFTVLVGIPAAAAASEWQGQALAVAAFLATFLLGLLFLVRLIAKTWQQQALSVALAAREQERTLLKTLIRTIPDLVWLKDAEGVYLACNREFERFFGKPEAEIVGKSDYDFMSRELAEFFRSHDRNAMDAGKPTINEEWITYADDGHQALLMTTKTPMRTSTGTLIGVLGIAHDITEARRQEQALRESQQTLNQAQAVAHIGSWKLDIGSGLLEWSAETYRIFGIEPGTPLDLGRFMACIDPDDGDAVASAWQAAVDTGAAYDIEHRIRIADKTRWVHERAVIERDETGRPLAGVGTVQDITERKDVEAALQRLNLELEQRVAQQTADLQETNRKLLDTQFAMDAVGIGISWVDYETGRFIHSNRTAAEALGYTPDEYLQLGVSDIDPNFPAQAYREIRERIREQGHVQFETEQRTRDGRPIPVEMTIHYSAGRSGDSAKLIAFMSDITHRREAERSLREARQAAEAANQAKSAFLANMSHEIRTPLNAILGLSHLMRSDNPSESQLQRLKQMDVAGRHLLSIINDILDLAKIEAGALKLDSGNFHLSAVLDNVASIIRETVANKGLALEVDPDGVPLWLHGDVTRLRQALLNFASNAVKFTERGRVILRALLLGDGDGGLAVRFEVADTGIGLTAEQQTRLFQAFEQADGSTARKYGGTGLGLALTKRLVELMNGDIGVISTAGEGSTFWFTVPLQRGHGPMPQQAVANSPLTTETQLRQRHRGARILLAEDNQINVEVVREMLHAAGLDVIVAHDGKEAVDRVSREDFDLILMDMQMPVMDGLDATRSIRALPAKAALPIVALTANAFAEDRRNCLDAGMNDILTKPVDPNLLYGALMRWLPAEGNTGAGVESTPARTQSEASADDGDAVLAMLAALPDVDVKRGLASLRGRRERYLALIYQLVATHGKDGEALIRHLDGREQADARELMHTLKGAASTLGLNGIADIARDLEAALRQEDRLNRPDEELREGAAALASALRSLAAALPRAVAASL
jgi:PAS domain S-box-containing protein